MRTRWKKRRLELTGQEEHRFRRGDLTLATVGPVHGAWYFHGLVPGGASVNTLARPTSGEDGPQTWVDVDEAKEAAEAWVEETERRVLASDGSSTTATGTS